MGKRIHPKERIAELSVEERCQTAEEYHASLVAPTFHMAKPFGGIMQAPHLRYHMSLLLSGLRLGQAMTFLDFGAGSCWFSRFLNQVLSIGQKRFELGEALPRHSSSTLTATKLIFLTSPWTVSCASMYSMRYWNTPKPAKIHLRRWNRHRQPVQAWIVQWIPAILPFPTDQRLH